MWLITGGAYQGKLEYAMQLTGINKDKVMDGETCNFKDLLETPMVDNFHIWIKRKLIEAENIKGENIEGKNIEIRYIEGENIEGNNKEDINIEGKYIEEALNQLIQLNPQIVIIVNELGCGIVPMDAFDRHYREITGRLCCKLAKEAEEVHRVTCGIGRVIKHA